MVEVCEFPSDQWSSNSGGGRIPRGQSLLQCDHSAEVAEDAEGTEAAVVMAAVQIHVAQHSRRGGDGRRAAVRTRLQQSARQLCV